MMRLFCGIIMLAAALFSAPQLWAAQAEAARREAVLLEAAEQAYTPPQAGLMPHPEDIPMGGAWEDPDWDSPLMQSIYKNPYSYGNSLDNYLPCLEEALGGNPKAMLAISMYYFLWGDVLEDKYPDFPPEVHSVDYWRGWAERVTSPGWVRLRLGDLHGRWPASSLEFYRQGAELGHPEAMYNYYKATGKRRDYLYRSAALGYPRAAFLLSEEIEKQGGAENAALAKRYIWLAALNADEWGLLHSSFSFYNGDFSGEGNSCEQGYLYALLNLRYQYGSSFSTQKPDNICMLAPDVLSRLEAAADRWQADYDQRRLPHVLRARYKREAQIAAMQDELEELLTRLGVARRAPGQGFGQSGPDMRDKAFAGGALSWHLGFYNEDLEPVSLAAGLENLSAYAKEQFRAHNSRYIPWIYAFVILSMLSGAALMLYGQRLGSRKSASAKRKNGKA